MVYYVYPTDLCLPVPVQKVVKARKFNLQADNYRLDTDEFRILGGFLPVKPG
jgi:hypothetical protein